MVWVMATTQYKNCYRLKSKQGTQFSQWAIQHLYVNNKVAA